MRKNIFWRLSAEIKQKKAGRVPRFCIFNCSLAPVALDQNIAVTTMLPVMGDPDVAGMPGARPVAVNPDVTVAIPAVIAVDPDPTFMRWMVVDLDDGRGRRDANDDLRHNGSRNETESKQQ